MKIGVKIFDSEEFQFLNHFKDKVDFIEVMAIQKNDYSFLKKFSLPMVIHAEHQKFGINPADILEKEQNLKSINFAIKIANITNSEKIIVHPGEIKNKNCSLKNAINFFKEINDDRIIIENLPPKRDMTRLCQTPREIETFMNKTKAGFCFDINHAISHLKKFNGDYNFLKDYIQLNPKHYHLGGQKINPPEEHLCFENSDINLKEILKYFPENVEITLETQTDTPKVENDIEIIKSVLGELRK